MEYILSYKLIDNNENDNDNDNNKEERKFIIDGSIYWIQM